MPSFADFLTCGGLALALYGCIGLPLAAHVAPRPLALMLAPALGWAVHSALALPIFFTVGMRRASVVAVFAAAVIAALTALWAARSKPSGEGIVTPISVAALFGAALLAFAVAAAVLPKASPEGIALAGPIVGHAKIALIDEMTRLGVPPTNPFFGGVGTPVRLSYHYLWHFSAAELALLTGASGWAADAGLTWFTAFASLAVMIGFAVGFSGRASSGLWVIALAATASMRPLLDWFAGADAAQAIVGVPSGFGGWLLQASWAPQHVASATAAVLAIFLLVRLVQKPGILTLLIFALIMAAAFESSTWIGGVVFPLAAAVIALRSIESAELHRRWRALFFLAAAVLLVVLLIAPFLYDQFVTSVLRNDGPPIVVAPYRVLGFDNVIGQIANLPAFWLIFLVVEFPAFYITGLVSLYFLLRDKTFATDRRPLLLAFAVLTFVSLGAAWLLVSTAGDSNDLGWRAVLPAVALLIVFAAAGLPRLARRPASAVFAAALALILLGVPGGALLMDGNTVVPPNASSKAFAATPALWRALREQSSAGERVASNPRLMAQMTPWPANISWALLANRRSCYAGAALVDTTVALPQLRRRQVDAFFARVFAGEADGDEISELAARYNCSLAVLTPEDGAWARDPFAASSHYRLVEANAAWRIYKIVKLARR